MRNEQQAIGEFMTTTVTPARLASLESDVFVPVLQGVAIGLSVGILGGVVTLMLGGPIAELQGGLLWAWAGRLAGVSFALGLSGSVVAFVLGHRRAIWRRERRLGQDLDGDGYIGEPERVTIEIRDPDNKKQTRYVDLPVSLDELTAIAVAVLRNGKTFSRPGLRGVLSQGKYNRLAATMVKRGLARDLPGNRRELTGAGRAILRKMLS